MEENKDNFDIQDMLRQNAELKLHLEEVLRMDEKLLKTQIMGKTYAVNNFGTRMLAMGIFGAVFTPALFYFMFDFSLTCCIVTSFLCIADAICDYWLSHQIKQEDYFEKSFTEMISSLVK